MANPLARVVMSNITKRSGKVSRTSGNLGISSSVPHLDNKEEQLLKSIVNKTSSKSSYKQGMSTLSNFTMNSKVSTPTQREVTQSRSNSVNKINLEELVKGNKTEKKDRKVTNKSKTSTMMTLDELSGKVKKNTEEKTEAYKTNLQKSSTTSYARTGVINNLEAYIPKVSLNSIGKKGSLLK